LEINTALRVYLLFFLFWGLFFFTSAEAAFFGLGRLKLQKLKEEGHPRHSVIERLLSRPRQLIITLLTGNEIFNVAISSLTSALFIGLWGDIAKWVAIPVVVLVILLLGEVVPKTLAIRSPEKIAPFVAPGLERFSRSVSPLVGIIIRVVDRLLALIKMRPEPLSPPLTEEEFKRLVETGQREGTLDEAERRLIHRVFEFGDKTVRNAMTPRSAIFALPLSTKLREAVEALRANPFSRVPVYRKNLDEIAGILYTKDLLGEMSRRNRGKEVVGLRPLLRKPHFVPLGKKLDELFKELQKQRIHLAVVVDEYGLTAGVVTLEDLLEELFGEIRDEPNRVHFAQKRGTEKEKNPIPESLG
jgi:putative hemolysin